MLESKSLALFVVKKPFMELSAYLYELVKHIHSVLEPDLPPHEPDFNTLGQDFFYLWQERRDQRTINTSCDSTFIYVGRSTENI